jgi:hypothetical protein
MGPNQMWSIEFIFAHNAEGRNTNNLGEMTNSGGKPNQNAYI